ncbi:hypothetical protein ACB265_17450 [Aeromonas dhakensis]
MIRYVFDEFKSTPIQTTLSAISLFILAYSLIPHMLAPETTIAQNSNVAKDSVIQALSLSIALIFICATIVKIIPRGVSTVLGSIAIASINVFLVIYIIDSNFNNGLSGAQLNSARDLAFYGVMVFYCVFNLRLSPISSNNSDVNDEGITIGALIIAAIVWGSLVSTGEGYLTGTFKPSLKEMKINSQMIESKKEIEK